MLKMMKYRYRKRNFVRNMLNAKILKLHLGDQKELRNESKTKEIEMKKCRKERSLAANTVIKCIATLAHLLVRVP